MNHATKENDADAIYKHRPASGVCIYLAGKIGKNDWRHSIVNNLRGICGEFYDGLPEHWPITIDGIAKNKHYTGPYFIGCDHGCFHGPNTHGIGRVGYPAMCSQDNDVDYPGTTWDNHCPDDSREEYVARRCAEAISVSDVVYAWIDDLTAFGSIFEIGLAVGMGKRVIVATPGDEKTQDLWFMCRYLTNSPRCNLLWESDALSGFRTAMRMVDDEERELARLSKIESPIERMLYFAMGCSKRLEPQHEINANGHRYRADFAIPELKIVIELDGHEFHKTKEQRTHDAKRERDLQTEGWKVIRFTGTEITNDVRGCAQEVYAFIRTVRAASA